MNTAVLSIGSNVEEAHAMIKEAIGRLREICKVREQSGEFMSDSPYVNLVMEVATELPFEDLHAFTKNAELQMGRTLEMKKRGEVPIDIDIVIFNGKVVRKADFASSYFIKGYRLMLLNYVEE